MVTSQSLPERFATSDTPLAAFLYVQGFSLLDTDFSEAPRVAFVFQNTDGKIQEQVLLFISGKALVEPNHYLAAYRNLVARTRDR